MQRNVGPTKRAVTIDPVSVVTTLLDETQLLVETGPYHCWHAFNTATWWLLRGAEVIALDLGNVSKASALQSAELLLGQTKTDIKGRGKRRGFKCTCNVGDLSSRLCPVCILCEVLEA